jgi:hypothetical protein
MTDWSLLLMPIALIAIVALAGFVGCSFNPGGIADPSLVSHWLLGETTGPTAADTTGTNNGTYTSVVLTPDVPRQSPGTANPAVLNLGAVSLLDAFPTELSVQVDGGYVEIPFSDSINTPQFTVFGWVHPEFDLTETEGGKHLFRSVVTSRDTDGGAVRGYVIYAGPNLNNTADPTLYWQAWFGTGVAAAPPTMLIGPPVEADQTTFLAITYDGTTAQLFVNGSIDTVGTPSVSQATAYSPNPSKNTFIGMGGTEGPSQVYPFKGRLQEFRYFNVAIPASTIDNNFMAGQMTP